jgi:tRNA splicing ligase
MITTKIKPQYNNENTEYPKLVQHEHSGYIVLLRTLDKGVIVGSATGGTGKLGELVSIDSPGGYTTFNGTLTLRNS